MAHNSSSFFEVFAFIKEIQKVAARNKHGVAG
jgi:hypothetical protein